jgi:hypothetical protein
MTFLINKNREFFFRFCQIRNLEKLSQKLSKFLTFTLKTDFQNLPPFFFWVEKTKFVGGGKNIVHKSLM